MSKSSKPQEDPVRVAVIEQAAAWFLIHREGTLSAEQKREFLAWLQASPLHVREYLLLARVSKELRTAAQHLKGSSAALLAVATTQDDYHNVVALPTNGASSVEASPSIGRWKVAASIAALMLMLVASAHWVSVRYDEMVASYATAHGEQRTVRLEDGSVLHVDADSKVNVDFSATARRVSIERGRALFKVAKDASRPFRVRAGEVEVVAVGTEFDVRRASDGVVVTVVEGKVALSEVSGAATASATAQQPLRLVAGQQARVEPGKAFSVQRAVDVRPAIAWAQQQIMFERETLRTVVSEFNRYGATPIIIEDSDLADLRISGVFNAYDLDSFVAYLEQLNGLVVRRDLDRVIISISRQTTEG